MKKSDSNNSNTQSEPAKRYWKPLAIIVSFFNPISTVELAKTFNENQDAKNRADQLLKETRELHNKIDEALKIK